MILKKMTEVNKFCWSCTEEFPTLRYDRNCFTCNEDHKKKRLYQYCNNKHCRKPKELNNKPLCVECYKEVRRLNEKETIAYNGYLIRKGRI